MSVVRKALIAVTLAVALTGLTACDGDGIVGGGSQQGFVSGNGAVKVLPPEKRPKVEGVEGTGLNGEPLSLADYAGKIVVLPVWGSWCGPCRKEAPIFIKAAAELATKNVAFLGINSRDISVENAQAWVRRAGLTYPSIHDPSGGLLLAFRSGLSPKSIPSVLFVDAEGRVAAAVRGEITAITIKSVIEEITA
ncbi:MAG: TlpA family protein disulfide reductase [Nocardioidaceae bacterium]|nr:MAG: TlpA family protein disulfide reductase [Nocardioidaceae bacterium]